VPALRGLRAAYPDETIALAAPAWLAPLVSLVGAVDRQLYVDGLTAPLPSSELAVNLHGKGPQSHRLLLASRPGRLLAFACEEAGFSDGPEWTYYEHEVHRWCRMLAWYGIPADPSDLDLARPAADGVPVGATVLHVGAKAPERPWPVDRFAAVARSLTMAGHRVVLTGSVAELPRALAVADIAGLPQSTVHAGRTSLARLVALVAYARLVVSADTGVAHLATAYRIPSVVMFGPEPPARWGPPADRPWHRPLWNGPAVDGVTVDEVIGAAAA
jgi:ADP-heptose:LPS heptosyltransferase